MRTELAISLSDYVRKHRDHITTMSGTLADKAAQVSADFGTVVKQSQLRDVLRANGIETKRLGQRDRERLALLEENERLTAENNELVRTLARVLAAEICPAGLRDIAFGNLSQEIRGKLQLSGPSRRVFAP